MISPFRFLHRTVCNRTRQGVWRRGLWVALLFYLTGCHDAARENPFDPALTPAVELTVALDELAGTIRLEWTRYAGAGVFAEYRVLRNVAKSVEVDTLERISSVEQTAFVDRELAPNMAYEYRVETVNSSGFAAESAVQGIAGYAVNPVELIEVAVDGSVGEATVRWTAYAGPRFEGYRVERRGAAEVDFAAIGRVESANSTAFVDGDLDPDVVYVYRVVLEAAGEEWASNRSGATSFGLHRAELLSVRGDSEEGVVRLRWTAYAGPRFEGYRVLRREVGTDREELLGEVVERVDTTFVDRTALAEVDYLYEVMVRAAGEELRSGSLEGRLSLPAVRIEEARFESRTATATLGWTAYAGPRFAAYRVERRTAELAWHAVAELGERESRSLLDGELAGNTEYFYRVVVVTDQGEEVTSREVSGGMHFLMDSWPLELEEESFVRLYVEEEGKLTALVADPNRIRLLLFAAEGDLLEEQELLVQSKVAIAPRSVATVPDGKGGRALVLTLKPLGRNWQGFIGVLLFDREGRPLRERRALFADAFTEPLRGEQARVPGVIELQGGSGDVAFDNVAVSQGEVLLFADDFERERIDQWSLQFGSLEGGWFTGGEQGPPILRKEGLSWQDFRVEAEVSFFSPTWARISMGSRQDRYSRFDLGVNLDRVTLNWIFLTPASSSERTRLEKFEKELMLVPGLFYRMELEFVEGEVGVSVERPASPWSVLNEASRWNCAVPIEQGPEASLALIAGDQPIQLIAGEAVAGFSYGGEASEMRSWKVEGSAASRLGLCLPEVNRVLISRGAVSRVTGKVRWPSEVVDRIGAGMGQEAGSFLVPLSLDASPEGRVYVLDAGNARIQVFDDRGDYITQFGHWGSEAGAFDFGSGWEAGDFAGSVVVDGEGFIYVADVGNGRIQKFAP